jgi:hypothetical protein
VAYRTTQTRYCNQLRIAINRLNNTLASMRRARNLAPSAAARARLAANIRILEGVREDKNQLRRARCR